MVTLALVLLLPLPLFLLTILPRIGTLEFASAVLPECGGLTRPRSLYRSIPGGSLDTEGQGGGSKEKSSAALRTSEVDSPPTPTLQGWHSMTLNILVGQSHLDRALCFLRTQQSQDEGSQNSPFEMGTPPPVTAHLTRRTPSLP